MDTADPRDGDQNMYSTIGVEKVRTEGNVVGLKIQSAQTDSGDIYGESFTALRVDQIQSGRTPSATISTSSRKFGLKAFR